MRNCSESNGYIKRMKDDEMKGTKMKYQETRWMVGQVGIRQQRDDAWLWAWAEGKRTPRLVGCGPGPRSIVPAFGDGRLEEGRGRAGGAINLQQEGAIQSNPSFLRCKIGQPRE
jgi:hypothetical protein